MDIKLFGKTIKVKIEVAVMAVPILIVIVAFMVYASGRYGQDIIIDSKTGEIIVSSSEKLSNEEGDELEVYVTGCVKNPGIVTLKKGQIINDAIEAYGIYTV